MCPRAEVATQVPGMALANPIEKSVRASPHRGRRHHKRLLTDDFCAGCEALHTPAAAFCRRISIDLLISAPEGVMDYDATCLLMGPASPLLNLIAFLLFSAFVLCATSDSGGGGHHERGPWAGIVRVALTRGV